MIRAVGFDGDDTLWHTESIYSMTERDFQRILAPYLPPVQLKQRLYETEMRNLKLFGYGIKGFVLSMLETALEVSDGRIDASRIQALLDSGKRMLAEPVEVIDGVEPTLRALAADYRLVLITKGDLFDQENKLAQSGFAEIFDGVSIVSDKDEATYERVLREYGVEPADFVMVGNSVRSDVLPVVRLGGQAVHVPYEITWAHEHSDSDELPVDRFRAVDSIDAVPGAIAELRARDRAVRS